MRVGVITVSYGSGEDLERFLASIRQFCAAETDVIVVDNKPGADGVEHIASKFGAAYLPLPQNPGYGAGMNAGARALRYADGSKHPFDAFFVCNPDMFFVEDSITPLAQVLASSPSIGAVGPTLLNDDGSVYPSARAVPSVGTGIGHGLFVSIWPNNPWTRAYKSSADYDQQRTAGWLSGAAVMVKASVWDELGGFDEGYFLNFEDIDLGFRIGKAGYQNVYVPTTRVVHSGGHSLKKHAEASERAMHESAQRFMRKRYAGFWRSPVRWAVLLGLRVRGALTLRSIRKAKRH